MILTLASTDFLRFMFDKIMPLKDAVEGYDIFDKMWAQKVVFEAKPPAEATA